MPPWRARVLGVAAASGDVLDLWVGELLHLQGLRVRLSVDRCKLV